MHDTSRTRQYLRALLTRVGERCNLPPLPAVAVRAMQLVRDPETTAEALTKLVSTDGALAARVLRMSRSALYARRVPPATLQDAILMVGFESLKKILVAASARAAYEGRDATSERLWKHALATALAADELGARSGQPRGGPAFIAGLLHDMGKLVLHLADPKAFATLGIDDEARETEIFGVTHAAVSGSLAEQWGLEETIVDALLSHHAPATSSLAACVAHADRLAQQIGHGSAADATGAPEDDADELAATVQDTFVREEASFS